MPPPVARLSHLTRGVFRSLTYNQPLLYRGCLLRAARHDANCWLRPAAGSIAQRRSFFGLFKSQRKNRAAELLPGFHQLSEVALAQRKSSRAPPPADIARAFNEFFAHKSTRFEDFHIHVVSAAWDYLQTQPSQQDRPWLSSEDIVRALSCLARRPDSGGEAHLAFATHLNAELAKRQDAAPDGSVSAHVKPNQPLYLSILCLYGASLEARKIAMEQYNPSVSPSPATATIAAVWTDILRGFANEKNKDELLQTAGTIKSLSIPFVQEMQRILVTFFSREGDLPQAKHWFSQPVTSTEGSADTAPLGATYAEILKACASKQDLAYGQQVVASLLKEMPNKPVWDAIFVWSAAIGKGVEEIDRMMSVMVRRNTDARERDFSIPIIQPDIESINALVEYAVSKQDSYSAERYIAMGEKRGILPNPKTYNMQVQYRLAAKDIDGAKAAYSGLQAAKDDQSITVSNKLIRALCRSRPQQFHDIMAIVDNLHEKKAWFEPATVAALSALHLRRGEVDDARDIIQVHAHRYSPAQRQIIIQKMVAFLLDRENSTVDAWDAYQLLRQLFPETPRPTRLHLMNEFFARGRPDMACHVFFHMRFSTHPAIRADRDVYVAAFTGFARHADAESLELAHTQLKLDLTIDLDTKLRNALMLAYAETDKCQTAMEIWTDIVNSKEGPTYNSIAIAFRACERLPWGDQQAKPLWKRLKQLEVDIDSQIFTAYLRALARNFLHEDALELVESAEAEYGFTPDLHMLANWFNATINIEKQSKVEEWIKEHYPGVWEEMEELGHEVTMDGFGPRLYNITAELEP
ncbi:hypothetical protein M011DRAFT_470996 [Sporormia fimetaria CBS 119925]|uniref:Complex I intermediate-associated protein-like protein 84 n=1 Tax=Sporormia fimetaria CBS 119925 TaxID=1340428 RepID=A0A6A6V216_9PLEO|nr:hypothetical protein M011DRAFT_470996 [Sporormia fimetaria CBS 119925]